MPKDLAMIASVDFQDDGASVSASLTPGEFASLPMDRAMLLNTYGTTNMRSDFENKQTRSRDK